MLDWLSDRALLLSLGLRRIGDCPAELILSLFRDITRQTMENAGVRMQNPCVFQFHKLLVGWGEEIILTRLTDCSVKTFTSCGQLHCIFHYNAQFDHNSRY